MAEFDGEDRRAKDRWRIKKEISLGDLIAFASAAIAVVFAYSTLDKRLAIVENATIIQTATDKRQDDDNLRYQGRIDQVLADMNRKLDRLIERR